MSEGSSGKTAVLTRAVTEPTAETAEAARRRLLRLGAGAASALAAGAVLGPAAFAVPALHAAGTATESIRLRELYEKDLSFSALARSLEGERVTVKGFMAPPLKAESSFFVLTKRPMANCPFCNDASDWPDDIVAVYTKRAVRVLAFNIDIVVRGRLELGDFRDPDTGFFSRLRLVGAVAERV